MDVTVGISSVSSTLTQVDLVMSPLLCQCLYVIKNVSEFSNLTYRITKTQNDTEMLIVFREGILGVLGPPVEPISLTLDHKGRCLLAVLFRPVQRVSIVSKDSGQLEVASLLAMLRLVAGKGYHFCPGLPEKFVMGKVCGKFVVLHKVPFKRYQSTQCLVYYQGQAGTSLCALCPRCLHAAKCINALPEFTAHVSPTAVQLHLPLDQRNPTHGAGNNVIPKSYLTTSAGCALASDPLNGLVLYAGYHNNTVTPSSGQQPVLANLSSNCRMTQVDVNGNSQTSMASKDSCTAKRSSQGQGKAKLHVLRELLTNLMQTNCQRKSLQPLPDMAGMKGVSHSTKHESSDQLRKRSHEKRNVCRHCKKQFSSPANLLSHLQRHEALTGTWSNKFRQRIFRRRPSVFSVMHRMRQELKSPSTFRKRKAGVMSEMSLRLSLKCLDDLILSQNGRKSLKQQQVYHVVEDATTVETQKKHKMDLQEVVCERVENGRRAVKCGVKRCTPMQTLLEAAAIAEVGHSLLAPSPATRGGLEEVAVSTSSQPVHVLAENVPQKKPRKSSRLASKRAKGNKKRTDDEDGGEVECCSEVVGMDLAGACHEQSFLTNLNLLSTVSLETAMRQTAAQVKISTPITISLPTVVSPHGKRQASAVAKTDLSPAPVSSSPVSFLVSAPISVSQNALNNTSGGHLVVGRGQEVSGALSDTGIEHTPSLPPVPPLLFAGDTQGKGVLYPLLPQQQPSSSQAGHTSSSLLRNLVTASNGQVTWSEMKTAKSLSPGNSLSPGKSLSPGNSCGAIDLSKPKLSQTNTITCKAKEKTSHLSSLSGLPHNIAQLVASNDNPSEVLQCFLMMTNSASSPVVEHSGSQSLSTVVSDKQADSNLQARMFASARNYRLDKGAAHSPQVQAVIASSGRTAQSGKAARPGNQTDEIQCGYKWSGSGGLVKERTQLVRELVSPDVMASYLASSRLGSTQVPIVSTDAFSTSHAPKTGTPQASSVTGWSPQTHNSPSSELALNLITSKLTENSVPKKAVTGRSHKATASGLATSSSPIQDWPPASPGSIMAGILRSSVTSKSGIGSQQPEIAGIPGTSQNVQPKTLSLSLAHTSSPTPFSSTSTPPSNCTGSSPSLAAMLRQPCAVVCGEDSSGLKSSFLTSPVSIVQPQTASVDTYALLPLPLGVHIKSEPMEAERTHQATTVLDLPVKTEQDDSGPGPQQLDEVGNSSLPHLTVDLSTDSDSQKLTSPAARMAHLATKHTSVRCKH